ncbi:dual specificity protein phosphatase 23-like [Photinus pyralis]|nr:dual specificity protein phosphatase 23-like [Photinus pyralis]
MSSDFLLHSSLNFSWIVPGELAGMACPKTKHMNYLESVGIKHLITLSPEILPPSEGKTIKWSQIFIEEFEAPSLEQILKFVDICNTCRILHEAVGIHCRMGRGRTGVMGACYLVRFCGLAPERALINLRLLRPGSVETREQERAVLQYHDYIRKAAPGEP